MVDVVDAPHAAAAARYRQLWSAYEENRDLVLMGAYAPGNDALLDEAMTRRDDMLAFLRQDMGHQYGFGAARAALIAGFDA
jgi:flagellum-specific ATP synthase